MAYQKIQQNCDDTFSWTWDRTTQKDDKPSYSVNAMWLPTVGCGCQYCFFLLFKAIFIMSDHQLFLFSFVF